jgi:hypothetical protein
MTWIWGVADLFDTKAIFLPSGENEGERSIPQLLVNLLIILPVRVNK